MPTDTAFDHQPDPSSGTSAHSNQGRTLYRASLVLRSLEDAAAPQRLSEVARATGLHLATCKRVLNNLIDIGYVTQSRLGYFLGPELIALSHSYFLSSPLVRASAAVILELAQSLTLTTSVFVRSGAERILVARADAPTPTRYQFPLGQRAPLDTGAGKVILSFMPDQERTAYLASYTQLELASGAIQTATTLAQELEAIRDQGYRVSESEGIHGTISAATPIWSMRGELLGVLNVVSHDDLSTLEKMKHAVPDLLRASELIGATASL